MNVKKYTFLTLLSTHLCAEAISNKEIKPFDGFYIGVMSGLVRPTLESDLSAQSPYGRIYTIKNGSNTFNGFLYGAMMGYGTTFGKGYIGIELGIQSDTTNQKKTYEFSGPGGSASLGVTYKRGIVFSGAPRLGLLATNRCLIYIKPAVEISNDQLMDSDGDKTKEKLKVVFVPTVGLEEALTSNILLRAEYSYNMGAKMTENGNGDINGIPVTASLSLKYTSHAVKLGIAYKF